jgi:hypothetical protein
MGLSFDQAAFDRVVDKLDNFYATVPTDLAEAGKAAAVAIVQSTLAGIGAGDQPFAPYSESYQKLLDSVGGKPQGTVNLRGVFLHSGQKNPNFRSAERRRLSGADRRAYITFTARGKSITAKTPVTRPALGAIDPLSEMSLDLISVVVNNPTVTIRYTPRAADYMIAHNEGTGRAPQRQWFSLDKEIVRGALIGILRQAQTRHVENFNRQGSDPETVDYVSKGLSVSGPSVAR